MDENKFIKFLIDCDVVKFGDFTLKNGTKSNIFFNFGSIVDGHDLYRLGGYFSDYIFNNIKKAGVMYGPAYKGINIVLATTISYYMSYSIAFPFFYDRKEKKDHGEGGGFVGFKISRYSKIVIVDDVITDCKTKLEQIEKLKGYGEVVGILVGVDRQEVDEHGTEYKNIFQANTDIKIHSLTTKSEILKYKELNEND